MVNALLLIVFTTYVALGTLLPSNATMPLPDNPTQSLDLGTLEAVDSFGEELDTLSVEFPENELKRNTRRARILLGKCFLLLSTS